MAVANRLGGRWGWTESDGVQLSVPKEGGSGGLLTTTSSSACHGAQGDSFQFFVAFLLACTTFEEGGFATFEYT